jgi:hypothetical protein
LSIQEIDKNRLEVRNIQVPQEWFNSEDPFEGYRKFIEEQNKPGVPGNQVVLVNLSPPFEAMVAGKEVCRLNLKRRGEKREKGEPIWIAPTKKIRSPRKRDSRTRG